MEATGYRRLTANGHLFLQLLSQPFVSHEFLVAAATGRRGLRRLARQLLQPVDLGFECVAFRLEGVAFGRERVTLAREPVALSREVGKGLVWGSFICAQSVWIRPGARIRA